MTGEHRPSRNQGVKRQPYPHAYKGDLAKVRAKAERREIVGPGVRLRQSKSKDDFGNVVTWGPVFKGDDDYWWLKLSEAFGTRSDSVCVFFMDQLIELSGGQRPSQTMLNAAIAIIGAYKPKNEGEAMLAAQMVAVNALTMKSAAYANANGRQYVPEREAKLAFRGARTFAEQTDVMARLKGRERKQRIDVHYHDHRQIVDGDVHVHRGGGDFGASTRDAKRRTASKNSGCGKSPDALPSGEHPLIEAVRSEDTERLALPRASGKGTSPLSPARLWAWIRRAKG